MHALNGRSVDRSDEIPRLDTRFRRGGIVDRRDHFYETVLHRHFQAQPAEFAFCLDFHIGEGLRIHVARVWVEPGDHALDGRRDELAVFDGMNVIRAHTLESIAEEIELLVSGIICAMRRREKHQGN